MKLWPILIKLGYFRFNLFLSIVFLAALSVVGMLYWNPAYTENQNLVTSVDQKRKEIIHIIRLNDFAKGYDALIESVTKYDKQLASNHSSSDLSEVMVKLADKHKIHVISETNKEKKSRTNIKPTIKSIQVEGSYKNMRQYIYELGKLDGMVFVDQFDMKNKDKSRKVKTSIKLVVYTRQG